MPGLTQPPTLPRATLAETIGIMADVFGPAISKGPIIRRPKVVALAQRLDLDRRGVRRMQRLRNKYGAGPLLLRMPMREQAVLLDPGHVHRVLAESPDPFGPDSSEKRSALAHFEPKGVLISHGAERADRRRYNEQVLDTAHPIHRLGERFRQVADEEAARLLDGAGRGGTFGWTDLAPAWFRMVRRVVFGDAARDDVELTDMLARLRADANWAFLHPRRHRLRERFFARMNSWLARAEPGSLAGIMAHVHATAKTAPSDQVPQWLFAFDAACMALARVLALLATHPEQAGRARHEIAASRGPGPHPFPYLRGCLLESVRLWPTTPMILRQTTRETRWERGTMPAGTGVLIFAPFFHRDDERLSYADRFSPELWLDGGTSEGAALVPFSAGPAVCPGQNMVLLLTTTVIAALLNGRQLRLERGVRLEPTRRLPAIVNPYGLRFRLEG